MTTAATVSETADDFDAAWGDGPAKQVESDEFTTHADDAPEVDAPADPDAEKAKDSEDPSGGDEVARLRAELDKTTQRLRSAEGRHSKFTSELESMRIRQKELEDQLAAKDKPAPAEAPAAEDDDDLDPEFVQAIEKRAQKLVKPVQEKLEQIEKQREDAERRQREAEEQKAYEAFESSIRAQVPEYDQFMTDEGVAELEAFVEAQSPVLRRAYRLAIDNGTADEVVEMLTHFKRHKTENSQQRDVDRKADAATAVPSRRTAIPMDKNSRSSKDNFDEAWEK